MDKTSLPYDVTKTAFYDGRVKAPKHEKALSEIVRLERDPQSGLIDHPPNFSKDCADAVAGVVYGLTYRREIWVRHRAPISRSLIAMVQTIEEKERRIDRGYPQGKGFGSLASRKLIVTPPMRIFVQPT